MNTITAIVIAILASAVLGVAIWVVSYFIAFVVAFIFSIFPALIVGVAAVFAFWAVGDFIATSWTKVKTWWNNVDNSETAAA